MPDVLAAKRRLTVATDIARTIVRRSREASNLTAKRWQRFLSILKPYEPMPGGKQLLDAEYAHGKWDYLRSIGELPRLGIVSSLCSVFARGGSILEIGCGDGMLLEQLNRRCYSYFRGVDISSVAISRARRLQDGQSAFVCAGAEGYVPERSFDLVIFNEVMEYFTDPLAVAIRYETFVAERGHFIVSMFAGIDTARTRHIWRRLESRYVPIAHVRVSTQRDYLWNIKAFRVHLPRPV